MGCHLRPNPTDVDEYDGLFNDKMYDVWEPDPGSNPDRQIDNLKGQ